MSKVERSYWISVGAVVLLIALVSLHIYRPGYLVEFSDTIYPIRPDLTLGHWMSWWWSGNLGSIWTNACWLPYLIIPYVAWALHLDPGLGQAAQYFSWLVVPAIGVAMCIHRLSHGRAGWVSGLCVALVAFNTYIAVTWTLCVAMYSMGSAALFAWAFVEGIERKRFWRGLTIAAFAALWMSPDAANPPLFLIVVLNTVIFGLWLFWRNGFGNRRHWWFAGCVGLVSILIGVRWLVPFVTNFTSYPLTSLATGSGFDFSWVTARAHLINVLRMSQYWYWGNPIYTFYATSYEKNSALIVLSFAPFLVLMIACLRAMQRQMRTVLGLLLIVFVIAFVAKNTNLPFSGISAIIYHLPLMSLFRDSEKFMILFTIDGAIAVGLAFGQNHLSPRFKIVAVTSIVAAVLGSGWLVLTGEMFWGIRGTPPLYVRIPDDYRSLAQTLERAEVHRVTTSPWDEQYTIGTKWGFLGADTEFFDDLPDRPLFHHAYYSYVDHPYADQLINLYGWSATADDQIAASIERRLGIDGMVVRNDLSPYIGIFSAAFRPGDLTQRYSVVRKSDDFTVYRARRRAAFARVTPMALTSDEYDAAFELTSALGLSDVPVVDLHLEKGSVVRMSSLERSLSSDGYLIWPQALGDGKFRIKRGRYTIVARASKEPVREIPLQPQSVSSPVSSESVAIMGTFTDIQHDPGHAEPSEDVFGYVNESGQSARGILRLAAFGQSTGACADAQIDGRSLGRFFVAPGKHELRVPAVMPPGEFTVRLVLGKSGTCSRVDVPLRPLWTAFEAPDAFWARSASTKLRSTTFTSTPVSVALSSFPTIAVNAKAAPKTRSSAETLLRAQIVGGGCSTTVAAASTVDAPAGMNVVSELRRIGRREMMPAACQTAALNQLRLVRVDAIAIADHPKGLPILRSISITPSNPATAWTSLLSAAQYRALAVVPNTKAPLWKFSTNLPEGTERGLFDFSAQNACGFPLGLVVTANESGRRIVKKLADLTPFQHTAGFGGILPDTPLPHVSVPMQSLFGDRRVAIDSIAIVPPQGALAPATCRAQLISVGVGVSAAALQSAKLTVAGRTFDVPRDDRPHRFEIDLSAGQKSISVSGPIYGAVILPSTALERGYDLPDVTSFRQNIQIHKKAWIVLRQAFDPVWTGSEATGSRHLRIPMVRADVNEQAFYVSQPGLFSARFRLDAAHAVAELITWGTLCLVVLIWIARRERV